jgi:predicted Zn-dependent protease
MSTSKVQSPADKDMAIWSLQYYLELFPNDTHSRRELAQRYIEYGEHRQAVREYRKLLCVDPHCYEARLELADSYIALEMLHRAACELRLLTLVMCYAPAVWERLARIERYLSYDVTQADAVAQQDVWERLQQ